MSREKTEAAAEEGADPRPRLWTLGAVIAVSALVLYAAFTTGEWRGAAVTELQVLVVGAATYVGVG
jgi:hypothetical protein